VNRTELHELASGGTVAMTPNERAVMAAAVKATLLRAAEIINGITLDDVREAQVEMFSRGCSLLECSRVDRAIIAAAHLKANASEIEVQP
jgi:hypothetical protein